MVLDSIRSTSIMCNLNTAYSTILSHGGADLSSQLYKRLEQEQQIFNISLGNLVRDPQKEIGRAGNVGRLLSICLVQIIPQVQYPETFLNVIEL